MPEPGVWVAPAAFAAAAVVALGGGACLLWPGQAAVDPGAVTAMLDGCAAPSAPISPGDVVFTVRNDSARALELRLTGDDGAVYAELDALAPRSARPLRITLGSGRYHFVCYFAEGPAVPGAAFTVPGGAPRGAAVRPLSTQDLTPVTLSYQRWVASRLPELRAAVLELTRSDSAGARAAWIAAHHRYETLGAAYDAFGAWDGRINGPGGGFHRIEAGLWGPAGALDRAAAADLLTAVDGLIADYPNLAIDPLDIGLRAHEITENTIEFTLTGADDHGSHTALDTAAANLTGTRRLLDELHPVLAERYPDLPRTVAALDRADRVVAELAARFPAVPVDGLPRADRARLNAAFGGLAERLAPIAAIADVRRTK